MNLTHPFQYDFLPRFYRLAIINILSNIVVPLAGLLSVAFLGHLTEIRHLAGVALASILFDYIYNGLGFLRLATTAMTAIAVGGDDREALLLVGLRNALIALGLGILILSLHYPLQELGFALLSAAPEVKANPEREKLKKDDSLLQSSCFQVEVALNCQLSTVNCQLSTVN